VGRAAGRDQGADRLGPGGGEGRGLDRRPRHQRELDGLNLHIGHPAQWGRFLSDVVPILRERGVVRTEYESGTLRGNLGLPIPENRYTRREAAL
jgi:hypothetical protein